MELDLSSKSPHQVLDEVWEQLVVATQSAKHPFHTAQIGTIDSTGFPQVRTVVLRHVDPPTATLRFNTDIRAPKTAHLRANPRLAWHFYAPELKIQVRMAATATIHHQDALCRTTWEQTALTSRRAYLQNPGPSTPSSIPTSGLPESLQHRIPTTEEAEPGYQNFSVVLTQALEMDWLYLASSGHRRLHFKLGSVPTVPSEASWLLP